MIYYVIFGTMLFFCIVMQLAETANISTKQIDKALFLIFSVVLMVMAAIRDNVGLDYSSYKAGYEGLHSSASGIITRIFDTSYFEPLFNLLNILAPSFRTLLIISAGLGILVKVFYFGKTNTRLFCLFLYYCSVFLYYDMGIIRQGISLSIVWFALKYVREKDLKRFLIWVFIAIMFHVTAILALPIYIMGSKRYRPKVYLAWLAIGLAVNMAYDVLIRLIAWWFGGSYIAYKLNAYTTYQYTESSLSSLSSTIVIRLGILVIMWFTIKKCEKKKIDGFVSSLYDDSNLFFNAYFISIVETIAFAPLFILATRGTAVLYFCYIPLFSSLVSNKNISATKRIIIFLFAVAFVSHTFLNILESSSGNSYIPYITIFR